MKLKFHAKLAEYDIVNLDDKVLNPGFVEKARAFELEIEKGTLTDEEIKTQDEELCILFEEVHEFTPVDSDEVNQLKTENYIHSVKEKVSEMTNLDELGTLITENQKHPELVEYINKRMDKVKKDIQDIADKAEKKKMVDALESTKKAKSNPAPAPQPTLQQKLLKKVEWTYDELRALGIKVTGQDMVVEGVRLKKKYLFLGYEQNGTAK
jgi:hypothetical protein